MSQRSHNRSTLTRLAIFAVAMFGFGFALVPFYRAICEVTGLNNFIKPDAPLNTQVDTSRWITVELDANTRGLPWSFAPRQRSVRVHPGQLVQVVYEVRNDSASPIAGQAIPSYGPRIAAGYFRKMECFCFQKQELAPGEVRQMPVVFVVDPELPKDVATVTLSYTFFELNGATPKPAGNGVSG
ncbi:MAG: cytochrome c oxidase assembly protein [Burkholderiales bacterium]|nr:cytochrome c oxidase assembly protein [Burkholderiales bacterium]